MFDGPLSDAADIKTIGAIGTGAMGAGTALSFAMAAYDVRLYGRTDKSLAEGKSSIESALNLYLKHGIIQANDVIAIQNRIHMTTSLVDAARNADFVIESIIEETPIKQKLFADLDKICPARTLFATNTSALSPTEIAQAVERKDKFVVTHFWNPPHLIPLVEVVPGAQTSPATMDITYDLINKIGKKAVRLEKEAPGFIGNRLQIALLREALHILDSGMATREKIDAAVTHGFGRDLATMGLFEGAHNDGFDRLHGDYERLETGLCNDADVPTLLKQLVKQDKLGGKKGEGIYKWSAADLAEIREQRGAELIRHLIIDMEEKNRSSSLSSLSSLASPPSPLRPIRRQSNELTSCAIESRLRHALLREAFYIVKSGIASAADVDIVVKSSIGRRLLITGPLTSADLGGLDIFESIFRTLGRHLCNNEGIPYLTEHAQQLPARMPSSMPLAQLHAI